MFLSLFCCLYSTCMALNFWARFENDAPYVQYTPSATESREVCGRPMERESACVCYVFCFDLSCYYPLLPAVKCAAVTAPRETRRQTVMSPQVSAVTAHNAAYVSRRRQRREGRREGGKTHEDNEQRRKTKGKRRKCQTGGGRKERETEKDGESCHHKESDSFLLFWI